MFVLLDRPFFEVGDSCCFSYVAGECVHSTAGEWHPEVHFDEVRLNVISKLQSTFEVGFEESLVVQEFDILAVDFHEEVDHCWVDVLQSADSGRQLLFDLENVH